MEEGREGGETDGGDDIVTYNSVGVLATNGHELTSSCIWADLALCKELTKTTWLDNIRLKVQQNGCNQQLDRKLVTIKA